MVVLALGAVVAARAEDEAAKTQALALNDLSGAGAMDGMLQKLMTEPAGTKKMVKAAYSASKASPETFNRNATLLLAVAAENVKDIEASAYFYRLNAKQNLRLHSEKAVGQAFIGLIQMYIRNKKFAESEKVCDEFLKLEGEEDDAIEKLKPMVVRQMILAIARQGNVDRAMKKVDELITEQPKNWLQRVLKAEVQREAGKLQGAIETYLDVIERVGKDKRLSKDDANDFVDLYRYSLSGLYVDAGQIDKAAEQLKLLLAREPDNSTYNNDLGYIWADHGTNLPESEKLIRKAIEDDKKARRKANPDLKQEDDKPNAAYLDSLGWVLFKQGKAKEAKPHLLDAVKDKENASLEVWDHLGDVHLALGEKAEAVAAWKKGIAAATDRKRDAKRKTEVEKKLEANKEK
jgi:tetratricopeptide (TPR) repeat protein